jgi:hypothetical protein
MLKQLHGNMSRCVCAGVKVWYSVRLRIIKEEVKDRWHYWSNPVQMTGG